ncbi:hypothetical protein A2985_04585 [Candidatus Woesebacteria bacterium RIFCSPLOWO2_01_FULL_43_11]|nr:MAG: hypothetical protein A2985_04585 [Candidatus Woesebacteria bacterium RIFCSPLOWO2_01_FULL_43_11]
MSRIRPAIGNRDLLVVEFKETCARRILASLGLSPSTGLSRDRPVLVVTHYRGKPLKTTAQAERVKRMVDAEIKKLKERKKKRAHEKAKICNERAIRRAARILPS